MNEALLALLTIAANTLITYFLLRQQDARLTRKNNQDQVKFQMLHEKRVKVLETLHEQYLDFCKELTEMMKYGHFLLETQREPERSVMVEITRKSMKKLGEIEEYVRANDLFLPDDESIQFSRIFQRAKLVHELAVFVVKAKSDEELDDDFMEKMENLSLHNPKERFLILHRLIGDLSFQSGMISAIYKSIADAEYKSLV